MRTANLMRSSFIVASGLCLSGGALADNCTGYDTLVTTSAETRDLGNGTSLTTFQSETILITDYAIYNPLTGKCSGTALATPDGKVRSSGQCARRDKDGHTASIEWSQAPGAERGQWKSTGGTGKFAARTASGWFQNVRSDGKMAVSKWGGNCS